MPNFNPNLIIEDALLFKYDDNFSVRYFLRKHKSRLVGRLVDGALFAHFLENICCKHDIDARYVLLNIEYQTNAITSPVLPKDSQFLLGLKGYSKVRSCEDRIKEIQGLKNQTTLFLNYVSKVKDMAEERLGYPLRTLDNRLVFPQNVATAIFYFREPFVGDRDFEFNAAPFGGYKIWLDKQKLFTP